MRASASIAASAASASGKAVNMPVPRIASRARRRFSGGSSTTTSAAPPAHSGPKVITDPNTASVQIPIATFSLPANTRSFATMTGRRRCGLPGAPIIVAQARVSILPSRRRSRTTGTGR